MREIESPQGIFWASRACVRVENFGIGGKVRNLKFPQNKKKIENSENLNYKIFKN